MKAIQLRRFGEPEVLQAAEVPEPMPRDGEALIRIHAAGVNFGDTVIRQGGAPIPLELPLIPGSEAVGVIERLGAGVDTWRVGDRVSAPLFLAGRLGGGYAQAATLAADRLFPIADDIGFDVAAALSMQGLTAWLMLRQVPVRDRTVLVHAAAGGVGSLLLQLARIEGARQVIATAGSATKRALASELGADAAIDYRDPAWPERVRDITEGKGVDVVFDSVGGDTRRLSLELLAAAATLVVFGGSSGGGYASGGLDPTQVAQLIVRNQSITGFSMWPLLSDGATVRTLVLQCQQQLFEHVRQARLRVIIGGRYPLEQAADAHRAIETRATQGKLLLIP